MGSAALNLVISPPIPPSYSNAFPRGSWVLVKHLWPPQLRARQPPVSARADRRLRRQLAARSTECCATLRGRTVPDAQGSGPCVPRERAALHAAPERGSAVVHVAQAQRRIPISTACALAYWQHRHRSSLHHRSADAPAGPATSRHITYTCTIPTRCPPAPPIQPLLPLRGSAATGRTSDDFFTPPTGVSAGPYCQHGDTRTRRFLATTSKTCQLQQTGDDSAKA